jgi:hypothetical protein
VDFAALATLKQEMSESEMAQSGMAQSGMAESARRKPCPGRQGFQSLIAKARAMQRMLHQGSGGQLCFVERTAEKRTAVAAELVGAGFRQLLGERLAVLPGFIGFSKSPSIQCRALLALQ